jgi:excinuclease UvrABC nuclease subunit
MSVETIKSQIQGLPKTSGIYRFFDADDNLLYVGKAKNLQKRVASYTKESGLSARISHMIFLAKRVEITETKSENEALLLEHDIIKKFQPKFNILLRDDKTFPRILITNHQFPRVTKYRGDKSGDGKNFGPFISGFDVTHVIDLLRKSFLFRNCSDAEFKSRKKPCLEYQIGRCSAPCVGLISEVEYKQAVENVANALSGKSDEVQKNLEQKMLRLSEAEKYEEAAKTRDQIKTLDKIVAIKNRVHTRVKGLEKKISNEQFLLEIKKIFDLQEAPQKIEVYDNSHTSGTNAVGAMIAAGKDGFIKSGYRKFNIRFEQGNRDDTAMLREVLNRRFSKAHDGFPDFIIIDGGAPQFSVAKEILKIPFVCMAKGERRNAGEEWFFAPGRQPFQLEKNSPILHYLQRLRDEAHRFAIMSHRKRRDKDIFGH